MNTLSPLITKEKHVKLFIILSICIFLFYLSSAVYVHRGFFYDGSNFYVGLLSKKFIWPIWDDPQHIRLFVNYLNQFLPSFAIFIGITELPVLRFLFNLGLFFTPFLIYCYCYFLSLRAKNYNTFLIALASTAICVLPSEIFILNQSITSAALCWVILHYLLLDIKLSKYDLLVIFCISFALFRAHEAMILWGPVMSFAAIFMLLKNQKHFFSPEKKMVLYFYIFIGIFLSLNALWWQSTHPTDAATASFLQVGLYQMHPSRLFHGNTVISMTGMFSLLISLSFIFTERINKKKIPLLYSKTVKVILNLTFIFSLIYSLLPFLFPQMIDPVKEMHVRFLIPFGSFIFMLFCIPFSTIRIEKYPQVSASLTNSIFICIAAASIWQISNNFYWNKYYKTTEKYLNETKLILIPPEAIRTSLYISPILDLNKFSLGWGWTVLGIGMLNNPEVHKLIKPEGFDDWFKLLNNKEFPLVPFIQFEEGGIIKFDHFYRHPKLIEEESAK